MFGVDAEQGAYGDVVGSVMMDWKASGLLCLRRSACDASTIILQVVVRWGCSISSAGLARLVRGTGTEYDLEDAADDEDDAVNDDDDHGNVPKESQEVRLTISVEDRSESFLVSVSACNSADESMSMGGDMIPGEVHLLSPSSEAASLCDHKELESSHTEHESSVSAMSDVKDKVGLVGLKSSLSSIASSVGASLCSCCTTDLAARSILCGAGSSRRTMASSTVSSAAAILVDTAEPDDVYDEV